MVASSHRINLPLCQISSVFSRAMVTPKKAASRMSRLRTETGYFDYNLQAHVGQAARLSCPDEVRGLQPVHLKRTGGTPVPRGSSYCMMILPTTGTGSGPW